MNTRSLIGAYQKASSLKVDCWPSEAVLDACARASAAARRAPTPRAARRVPQGRTGLGALIVAGMLAVRLAQALALATAACAMQRCRARRDCRRGRAFSDQLWPAAHARGISRTRVRSAHRRLRPRSRHLELADHQPEHVKPPAPMSAIWSAPSASRPADAARRARGPARARSKPHTASTATCCWPSGASNRPTAPPRATRRVVRSLATLAMVDTRRGAYWKKELLAALRILQDGATSPRALVGSWAGAMGHTQFMPSTYAAHAVDFDRDGRRDIWDDGGRRTGLHRQLPAARPAGRAGEPWGYEVILPARVRLCLVGAGPRRALRDWLADRRRAAARPARLRPRSAAAAAHAAGRRTRARVPRHGAISAPCCATTMSSPMRWRSAHLADRIAGGAALATAWPTGDTPLSLPSARSCRSCCASGARTGDADGIIGDQTGPPSAPSSARSTWPRTATRARAAAAAAADRSPASASRTAIAVGAL